MLIQLWQNNLCITVFNFMHTISFSHSVLYKCVPGLYLVQKASAVTGHGKVSQEREGELLDRAVIWGDPWGQLHDRVHQRVAKGAFRSWCNTGATATKRTACWMDKKTRDNHKHCFTSCKWLCVGLQFCMAAAVAAFINKKSPTQTQRTLSNALFCFLLLELFASFCLP